MISPTALTPVVTDVSRWSRNAGEKPVWDERNRIVAALISPGSTVLDIGAGAMTLARHLPAGCEYQPMDVVAGNPQTWLVDFNAGRIPDVPKVFDFVVCSGVMEYVLPIGYFLNHVARWGRKVILSYATTDLNPELASRQRSGWVNHFSERELRRQLRRHGLLITARHRWQKQIIFQLDPAPAAQFLPFDRAVEPRADVQSVFRFDPTNAGDYHSAPFHYIDFGTQRCVDIIKQPEPAALADHLIVGGGGLLGSASFAKYWKQLFARDYKSVVGWGLGDNAQFDAKAGFVARTACTYPDYVKRFDLLGVRDIGTPHEWVPCASCLHPLFDEEWPVERDVVVYEHKRVPTGIDEFPKMNNDTNDLARVLRFLGSGRVVITNSYHGVYWAQLLGRAVLAFPFSSKFYHFKHQVTLCEPAAWRHHLDRVEEPPPALHECVAANLRFARRVQDRLGSHATPGSPVPVTLTR